MVQPGAIVEEFDPLCEVQSDKASVEITSRYAGKVKSLLYKEGEVAKVGSALCEIERETEETESASQSSEAPSNESKGSSDAPASSSHSKVDLEGFKSSPEAHKSFETGSGSVLATPAVRRISRENDVDLRQVKGTGKDGRITKEDMLNYVQSAGARGKDVPGELSAAAAGQQLQQQGSAASPAASTAPEELPLDPIRRAMFRAMTATLQVPHFAFSEEIDVTALEDFRKTLSDNVPSRYRKTLRRGESEDSVAARAEADAQIDKITMLPLLVKALSLALEEYPLFRSYLSIPKDAADAKAASSGARLLRRDTHDISIALSTPHGLLTPALRSVESQSVYSLASRISQLQTRGSSAKGLPAADLRATGTISLSNIGAVGGGTYTHPLLPPTGQLAIGALGRTRALPRFASETPGWKEEMALVTDPDAVVRRLIMPVSFTGDHRVVEGAELAKFVLRWKELVEKPQLWLGLLR
jgi:2-oxoisovalerate dehydrogenase E2 component (dihydrolipoyl transacylase)